jgi:hypothetical protein
MTEETFNKYYKNSKVRVEWDHSITGIIKKQEDLGYVMIDTNSKLMSFPLDQLEWVD